MSSFVPRTTHYSLPCAQISSATLVPLSSIPSLPTPNDQFPRELTQLFLVVELIGTGGVSVPPRGHSWCLTDIDVWRSIDKTLSASMAATWAAALKAVVLASTPDEALAAVRVTFGFAPKSVGFWKKEGGV